VQPTLPAQEELAPQINDVFYPVAGPPSNQPGAYFWLDGGNTLVVPNRNEMQYINLDNRLIKTVTIPADKMFEYYWLALTDNRIFITSNDAMIFNIDGKLILSNGSIWDSNGNLVREFLGFESIYDESQEPYTRYFLSDGREVGFDATAGISGPPLWINDDLVALNGHSRLFLYRVSTDTITLVDDMSDMIERYNNFSVYYGIHLIMPTKNGCYYFAYKDEQKANTAGTVWYADETGVKVLFGGREFSRVIYENGMLLMMEWGEDFHRHTCTTQPITT
jgi:hypothetical protein